MRVGIGVIAGVQGGPARYGRELVRALAEIDDPQMHLVVFTDQPSAFASLVAKRLEIVHVPLRKSWEQAWWDFKIAAALRKRKVDLYHGTKGILPPVECAPYVVTIHDVAVFHVPQSFSRLQRLHLRLLIPRTIRLARRVLTISQHSRKDLLQAFPSLESRLHVTPLAAASVFSAAPHIADSAILARWKIERPYLLYAGTIQPRKGVEELVRCFEQLKKSQPDLTLVLAGRVRPGYKPGFLRVQPPGVRYLGEVSDEELAALYRNALAFCSPSSYEGFGLSFLEAMQCGCPVIAPRLTSVPEVVGDAACFFNEEANLSEALKQVVEDEALRSRLRAAGLARAREFTWAKTAAATAAIYREAIDG